MIKVCISLFITGIVLGSGPCLVSCGPILVSYIAATKRSALGGLWGWFIFSTSRVLVYIFLGTLTGIVGTGLFRRFYWEMPGYIIWLVSGVFICFLGLLIFLGKDSRFKICALLNESMIQKDTKSLIVLGLLIGIFPCAPLIGIFSYIAMTSTHYLQGVMMSIAFGIGTLFSPLLLLGLFAGTIPKLKMLQNEANLSIFQKICGLILFLLGLHILIRTILEYLRMA